MAALVQIHSMLRWLVLAGLASSVIGAVPPWARPERTRRIGSVAAALLDVQVALGIVLWLGSEAWASSVFFAVVHPLVMLAALGVMHASAGRTAGEEAAATRILAGSGLALALVVAGIPWWR